ncbi:MAG: hypothetical protein DCF22_22920 [Leptolyngbya sp.]|nr:MAG: hypothetical protein DCF22_22920 [Leptolyngbya sp.]
MEGINVTPAGFQESILPEVERFWIENPPLSSVSSFGCEKKPPTQKLETFELESTIFGWLTRVPPTDCNYKTALAKANEDILLQALERCKQQPKGNKSRIQVLERELKKVQQPKAASIRWGALCTTPNGYQVKVFKADPKDALRVIVLYQGSHQYLGEDSYKISMLTPVGGKSLEEIHLEPTTNQAICEFKAKVNPSNTPEQKERFEVSGVVLEGFAKLNSAEALTRNKIKGTMHWGDREWIVYGSTSKNLTTLSINAVQVIERSEWGAKAICDYRGLTRSGYEGLLIQHKKRELVLTNNRAEFVVEQLEPPPTPEQPEPMPKPNSRRVQVGCIEEQVGNKHRQNENVSFYYHWSEVVEVDSEKKRVKRSLYLPASIKAVVEAMMQDKQPYTKTVEFIRSHKTGVKKCQS